MRLVVEVVQGPDAGRTIERTVGRLLQVGRSGWADLTLTADPALADLHMLIECTPEGGFIRDLGTPTGTLLNGSRVVGRVPLHDGDRIRAGESEFLVRLLVDTSPAETPGPEPVGLADSPPPPDVSVDEAWTTRLIVELRAHPGTLFAVLDAARTPEVLALLIPSKDLTYQSLYEGLKGEELAAVAPYLVEIPEDSPLLETLARRGWGNSWGVYLTCDRPFAEVRKHLRRFLMAELEGGPRVYFRFYDPRVLRLYLPTCDPREAREFFGPIRHFLLEAESPATLLGFAPGNMGVHRIEHSVRKPANADRMAV